MASPRLETVDSGSMPMGLEPSPISTIYSYSPNNQTTPVDGDRPEQPFLPSQNTTSSALPLLKEAIPEVITDAPALPVLPDKSRSRLALSVHDEYNLDPLCYADSTFELDAPSKRKRYTQLARRVFKRGEPTQDLDISLAPWRYWLITFALLAAGFMVGLDQSIMGPALPTIAAQFQSLDDIGIYQSAYLLPQCVLLSACNKLYAASRFSTVYLGSVLVFAVGCIISATAHNSPALIGGRLLSGIGAVGLGVGGYRLFALQPPSKTQNITMGAFSAILGCSIVVGPILGGIISDNGNWPWIFWINLPVFGVVLACVLVAMFFGGPDLRGENYNYPVRAKLENLDWLGTSLYIVCLTSLILALQFSQTDSWRGARTLTLLVLSAVFLVGLVAQQWSTRHEKIFDPAVMRHRAVWTTSGMFFATLSALSVIILFLPFLLQFIKGVSPRSSGLQTFPIAGSLALATALFSIMSTMVPFFNPLAIVGIGLLLASSVLLVTLDESFTNAQLIGYEVMAGFGVGMSWMAQVIYPRAVLSKTELAKSLSYSRMFQQLGSAIGSQLASIVFASRLGSELSPLELPGLQLSTILAGDRQGLDGLSASQVELVLQAFSVSIRSGLILAVAWAGIALAFTLALPWLKLQKGVSAVSHVPQEEADPLQWPLEMLASQVQWAHSAPEAAIDPKRAKHDSST